MKYINLILFFITIISSAQNSNFDKTELNQLHKKTEFIRDSINKLIQNNNLYEKKITDNIKKKQLLLQTDSLWNISDQNDVDELKIDIQYCKNHPTSMSSFELVQRQVARQSGKNFYEDFEYIYKNSSKEIKESEVGIKMLNQLKYFKKSMIGSFAPNISGVDFNNNIISLNDFKGKKYVLIDFWASWCAPCREELPFLKKIYKKYKSADLEILSISIDEDLGKWKKTIEKEQIEEWKNFSTLQNNSFAKTDYFVNGIPHKVLIDKNGKIIGKWKASGKLNEKSLENQLIQIFGY